MKGGGQGVMTASEDSALRAERNRFVKLAFCRADLVFELDRDAVIVFAGGATEPLFGVPPERLAGQSFYRLVVESVRSDMGRRLSATGRAGRIEDEATLLNGPAGMAVQAVVAGYRAEEYRNHIFLAIKIAGIPPAAGDGNIDGVMNQEQFSQAAAGELRHHLADGGEGQVTLVRVRNFRELLESLEASDRKGLTTAICEVLKGHSLGGSHGGAGGW